MDHINIDELLKLAIEAAVNAGKEIIEIYKNDFDVELKDDSSPLTIADKNANSIINLYLIKTNIPIISEENKQTDYSIRKEWDLCWIVDPLDGTKEFIKKNGEFTVNIALIKNNKPILGIIYVPVTKELFYGNSDTKKAYKLTVYEYFDSDELYSQSDKIIRIPNQDQNHLRIVGSRSHMNKETEEFVRSMEKQNNKINIVSKGSSLKFCIVAEGKADIYPRFAPTMEWDTAAGHAICNAVGIQIIDKNTNKELLYNKENLLNPSFISK